MKKKLKLKRPHPMSDEGLNAIYRIDVTKNDYVSWIENIVTEIAEISILRDIFEETKKIILSTKNKNKDFFVSVLHEEFCCAYFTKIARILEPPKIHYEKDDYSLTILLTNYNDGKNNDISADIKSLKELHLKIKPLRDKEIAHFTIRTKEKSNKILTWDDLDNLLQTIQKITNKYLGKITGNTITNWKEPINIETYLNFTQIKYYNGAWLLL